MELRRTPLVASHIDIGPVVDLLLVLLALLALSVPRRHVFDLNLVPPHASLAHLPESPVVLDLRPDHSYELNNEPIAKGALSTRLHQIFAGRQLSLLFIRAAGDWRYGEVLEAADIARGAGVQVLALLPAPQ